MMTAREEVVARVTEMVERIGRRDAIEPVEVNWLGGGNRRMLRIFIEKPGGITHADCEMVSRQLGVILDVEDVLPGGGYTLEVSSPGVERKLTRPKDFERFVGHKVKIQLREAIASRRHWVGTLAGFDGGVVTLAPDSGTPLRIEVGQIEQANLKFEW
jgi:ribosome maturation factor RimP